MPVDVKAAEPRGSAIENATSVGSTKVDSCTVPGSKPSNAKELSKLGPGGAVTTPVAVTKIVSVPPPELVIGVPLISNAWKGETMGDCAPILT